MRKIAPYGTWHSPISAEHVAKAQASGDAQWVGLHDGQVWWTEPRPAEAGRVALLCADQGGVAREVLAAPWSVRNRVHEYGGHPFALINTQQGLRLAFTNWADQRIYLVDPNTTAAEPEPITPLPLRQQGDRYVELVASPNGDEVWCVKETQLNDANTEVTHVLVAIPLDGTAAVNPDAVRILADSHHFMISPQPSPDGTQLAWIGWNHPAMPWDGNELCVATLDEHGQAGEHRVVAGGPTESVCQFRWETEQSLLALTDPTGWWNLHRIDITTGEVHNLLPCEEEIGGPLWWVGCSWFAPLGDGQHAVIKSGSLAILDEHKGTVTDVPTMLPVWSGKFTAVDNVIVGIASSPTKTARVVRFDLSSKTMFELTSGVSALPNTSYLPIPEHRLFANEDGQQIPAYVYPPTNPEYVAPEGELPPYLVLAHGGPTLHRTGILDLQIVFFTSRGIGVVVVNYGGSTGYGREFRERLRGQWGVVDVLDCAYVANALAAEGTADPRRLAIRGGSAGGFTTAAALTSETSFCCGTAMFPGIDLLAFAGGETHDFESRYLDGMIGQLPEAQDRYLERSPINRVNKLSAPILILQGREDQICKAEVTRRFVQALSGKGIPHAYLEFAGEQHGFRKAETVTAALQAELSFYG